MLISAFWHYRLHSLKEHVRRLSKAIAEREVGPEAGHGLSTGATVDQSVPRDPPVIAAILSNSMMEDRVRRALQERAQLFLASTWDELLAIVEERSASVVLADCLAPGLGTQKESMERLRSGVGVPLILYTRLTPQSAGILVELGQSGIRHLVFADYDDGPRRLLKVLRAEGVKVSPEGLPEEGERRIIPVTGLIGAVKRFLRRLATKIRQKHGP